MKRFLNTSRSKSSIYRWKQKEANKYNTKDIIARLEFSGVLSLDEYMPTRSHRYHLIAGDAIKRRILYIEPVSEFYGRGYIEDFLCRVKELGIEPWAIIFDLLSAFPNQAKRVWPNIVIQFDYFHVMQWIHKYFKNALIQFRRSFASKDGELYR